ncbi:MAG: winged helix family transcriptional regulator [Sphingobacteriaceae bacterium]|nr:MAG: winged helix family transcriptional regulator [Sphingobacteriaceae bacterium]
MSVSLKHLSPKRRYGYGLIALTLISVLCVAFIMPGSDDFDIARREILLRRIGHEILLQSGDSTSRVLPVKKMAGNEYQVSFDKELSFEPEALVNTTRSLLARDPLANDYVVKVLNCSNSSVAYGYAISKNKKDDIVACVGRKQPSACYIINISFKQAGIITAKNGYILGSLPVLALVGFIFLRPVKPKKSLPVSEQPGFALGSLLFDAEARTLAINGNTTELTRTEARVLSIFALLPNETIERSRLQKEIWEDEGVIVGRSLDMFISKLRKKLEPDPNIKIVVIRGRGYKLEIND